MKPTLGSEEQDAISEAFRDLFKAIESAGMSLDFFRVEVRDADERRFQCTVVGEGELKVVPV